MTINTKEKIAEAILDFFKPYRWIPRVLLGSGAAILGFYYIPWIACIGSSSFSDNPFSECNTILNSKLEPLQAFVGIVLTGIGVYVYKDRQEYELEQDRIKLEQEKITVEKNIRFADFYEQTKILPADRKSANRQVVEKFNFTVPELHHEQKISLKELKKELDKHANTNMAKKHGVTDGKVPLNDRKSEHTIFTIGNTRFSTYVAIVSNRGSLLMIDRQWNKAARTNEKGFDFFGSVGYENYTLREKLLDLKGYPGLTVKRYKRIPGLAVEKIKFHDSEKIEIAVMIGHLVVVEHDGIEKIRKILLPKNKGLVIFDLNPSNKENKYPDNNNGKLTSKASLAIDYIKDNEHIWKLEDV